MFQLALDEATSTLVDRDAEIKEHKSTIEEYSCSFREHEAIRRQLHNTIQELKVTLLH